MADKRIIEVDEYQHGLILNALNDKSNEIESNDIPDIIARFHDREGERSRKRTDQSFLVPKQEIVDNGYDLSINKYKETEYVPVEYPPTSEIMAQLRVLENGYKIKVLESDFRGVGVDTQEDLDAVNRLLGGN